jgi:hypothetical protein
MQMSLLVNNPQVIDDVFNYNYNNILNKEGGSVSISEVVGIPENIVNQAGLGNMRRIKATEQLAEHLNVSKGSKVYVADVAGKGSIVADSPNNLIYQIATHLGSNNLLKATDPLYEFLGLQLDELATPKNISESNLRRMQ